LPVADDDRIAAMRRSYELGGLAEPDLAGDWLTQFRRWFADAEAAGLLEPNWLVLATADAAGRPDARCVLLKAVDERGFVFYTNYDSAKGRDLAANPHAALVIPWVALQRQVRIQGGVERVTAAESDRYFASRPHGSQIGAAASPQSQVVASREVLDDAYRSWEQRYPDDTSVPRPEHWGGFRVVPATVEFWQGRRNRMHDRLRFRRAETGWVVERLAP
jgi:pyridoxamine 5'-phosphate oxidase